MMRQNAMEVKCWRRLIVGLSMGMLLVAAAVAAPQSARSDDRSHYEFKLEKGGGTPVCNAYLQRLNETEFDAPPFCGRPENDQVPGFSLLHRLPLTPAETQRLYPRIMSFLGARRSTPPHPMDNYDAAWARSGGSGPAIFAWRYDPWVDIDNDGTPRQVVVWTGPPFENANRPCGSTPEDPRITQPLRWTQLAFVLTRDGQELDDERTLVTFGRPPAGAAQTQFYPLGLSLSLFSYRNQIYFDTFLEPPMQDHLAVFVHSQGVTRQVCQYVYRGKRAVKSAGDGDSHE